MLYSEYLTQVKHKLTVHNRFICHIIKWQMKDAPLAYNKKLRAKIQELLSKQHLPDMGKYVPTTLMFYGIKPNRGEDTVEFTTRMKHELLDRMIRSALKREAKVAQHSLF